MCELKNGEQAGRPDEKKCNNSIAHKMEFNWRWQPQEKKKESGRTHTSKWEEIDFKEHKKFIVSFLHGAFRA